MLTLKSPPQPSRVDCSVPLAGLEALDEAIPACARGEHKGLKLASEMMRRGYRLILEPVR